MKLILDYQLKNNIDSDLFEFEQMNTKDKSSIAKSDMFENVWGQST